MLEKSKYYKSWFCGMLGNQASTETNIMYVILFK